MTSSREETRLTELSLSDGNSLSAVVMLLSTFWNRNSNSSRLLNILVPHTSLRLVEITIQLATCLV